MKRILLLSFLLASSLAGISQTNIALTATAAHNGGGVTTYGPQNYNDGIITAAPATTPWGWLNTGGWIEYTWPTVQSGITKVKFWKADRPMGSCIVQYWDGTQYVNVTTFNTPITTFVDSVIFAVPITTTRLRFDQVNGSSNPNHREIEVFAGPPCPGPTNLSVTSILSTSATVSWTGVAGSFGYEYFVDQNPTPVWPYTTTPTAGTSANVTGLQAGTNYYLHVFNKCSAINFSPWENFPFTTLPPCLPPINFRMTNLTPTAGTINWDPWPSALDYDYLVDQSRNAPTSTTGLQNISTTSDNIGGLKENTWYYVHIRSKCAAGEMSGWSLDSFLTPIPCRPPTLNIQNIDVDHAVAYWAAVPTANQYEYALTSSPTPPALGTKYPYTSIQASSLNDGKDYYIHVRSYCTSVGVDGISDWATASFKTWPVNVNNVNAAAVAVHAFPNPVKGVVTIQVTGNRLGVAGIVVTDMAGKTVRTADVSAEKTDIDMSSLPAGMYLVKYTDQSTTEVIRVTKQ